MKNKMSRVVSAILIAAFLVSFASVFATATDTEATTTTPEGVTTIFNRDFDDGWELNNGGSLTTSDTHSISFGVDEGADYGNLYMKLVSSGTKASCFYQISPKASDVSTATEYVIEFSVREDEDVDITADIAILLMRFVNNGSTDTTVIRRNKAGQLVFAWGKSVAIGNLTDEWTHISLGFTVTDTATNTIKCDCYVDGVRVATGTQAIGEGKDYLSLMRFQLQPGSYVGTAGTNICFDNMKYYVGTSEITELGEDDYGKLVNTSLDKTVSFQDFINQKYYGTAYVMKVGTNRALKSGERVNIFDGEHAGKYGAPVKIDGKVYLPLVPLLDHMGYSSSAQNNSIIDITASGKDSVTLTLGNTSAIVGGKVVALDGAPGIVNTGLYGEDGNEIAYVVVAMDDIEKLFEGWYITYDDMGMIILAGVDNIMNRDKNLQEMVDMMREFVPDYTKAEDALSELKEATNNFDHPYLYGNDEDFDFLRSIYNKEYLLSDGKPNEEFLSENGLSLEDAELLRGMIAPFVRSGVTDYVAYVVPDITVNGNANYFFSSAGKLNSETYYTHEKMYDADGNFIYPYDDTVRGPGKTVFAPMFTTKTGDGSKIWDFIEDDYVIVNAYYGSAAKKDYVYNPVTDSYDYVGEGNGVFDYVKNDYVDLKAPEKNYTYDATTGTYTRVTAGTGTHDLVGTDSDGNPIYAVLRTPLNNYARYNRVTISNYSYAFPFINYFTFDTDPSDPDTYLEVNAENPTLCRACGVDHFGYDCVGSRQSAQPIADAMSLAFAYMITGELNYARLAYDILDIMGNWPHWGPAHALNMCEAAGSYAIALDWIYDAVVEMSENGETNYKGEPMSVKVLQQHLWEHGVGEDYVMSVLVEKTAYLRDNVDKEGIIADTSSFYYDNTNNWGNVCNGNIMLAAMGLLSYTDLNTPDTHFMQVYSAKGVNVPTGVTYQSLAAEVLENKLWCLPYYASYSYVPDGAYSESPGYWAYGTNELLSAMVALYKTVGHDYGILDCPGYDKTFIYAASMETELFDGRFVNFNYNDGGMGSTDTSEFFTAALLLDQPELAALRLEHLKRGKGRSFADIFLFRDALKFAAEAGDVELDLEYASDNLDLFVTRSSWDDETPLFAGMMGGQSSMNHGHLDNGSWVYYNKGICWVVDIGSESYNVYNDTDYPATSDWNATTGTMKLHNRYRYYRLSAEGHNTLIITSRQSTLPYGQNAQGNAYSHLVEIAESGECYYADENGSYAILDMKNIYRALNGDEYAKSAYRGMLLTNGRKTLIIQDEIQFNALESIAWSAHVDLKGGYHPTSYEISADKHSIYLKSSSGVCRMTIVPADDKFNYCFEVRDTDSKSTDTVSDYLLDATFPIDSHKQYGGDSQSARSTIKNIIVTPRNADGSVANVGYVELAVVMETFDSIAEAQNTPVSYEYMPMAKWKPYAAVIDYASADGRIVGSYVSLKNAIEAANADTTRGDVTIRLNSDTALEDCVSITRDAARYGKVILDMNGYNLTLPNSDTGFTVDGGAHFVLDGEGATLTVPGGTDAFAIEKGEDGELTVCDVVINKEKSDINDVIAKVEGGHATFDSIYMEADGEGAYFYQSDSAELDIRNSYICHTYSDAECSEYALIFTKSNNESEAADGNHIEITTSTVITAQNLIGGGTEADESHVTTKILVENSNIEIVNYGHNRIATSGNLSVGANRHIVFRSSNIMLAQNGIYHEYSSAASESYVDFYDCYIEFTGNGLLLETAKTTLAAKTEKTSVRLYGSEVRLADGCANADGTAITSETLFANAVSFDGECVFSAEIAPDGATVGEKLTAENAAASVSWKSTATGAVLNVIYYATIEDAIAHGARVTVELFAPAEKVLVKAPATVITNGNKFTYNSKSYKATAANGTVFFSAAKDDEISEITYSYGDEVFTETYANGGYFWLDTSKIPNGETTFDPITAQGYSLCLNGQSFDSAKIADFEAGCLVNGDASYVFSYELHQYGWIITDNNGNFIYDEDKGDTYAELVERVNAIESIYWNPFANDKDGVLGADLVLDASGNVTGFVSGFGYGDFGDISHTLNGYTIKLFKDYTTEQTLKFYTHGQSNKVINYDLNGHTITCGGVIADYSKTMYAWEYDANGAVVQIHGMSAAGAVTTTNLKAKSAANKLYTVLNTSSNNYSINLISSTAGADLIANGNIFTISRREHLKYIKYGESSATTHITNNHGAKIYLGNPVADANSIGPDSNVINVYTDTLFHSFAMYNCYSTLRNLNVISSASDGMLIHAGHGHIDVTNCNLISTAESGSGMINVLSYHMRLNIKNSNIISYNPQKLYKDVALRDGNDTKNGGQGVIISGSRIYNAYLDANSFTPAKSTTLANAIIFGKDCYYNLEYNPTLAEGSILFRDSRSATTEYEKNAYANETFKINGVDYTFTYKISANVYDVVWKKANGEVLDTKRYAEGGNPVYTGVTMDTVDMLSSVRYSFSATKVTGYTECIANEKFIPAFRVSDSLVLESNLVHKIRIYKLVGGEDILNYITKISLGGTVYFDKAASVNKLRNGVTDGGVEYYYISMGVKSNEIAKGYDLEIEFTNTEGTEIKAAQTFSIVNYLNRAFATTEADSALYNLLASVVKYGAAAYANFESNADEKAVVDALAAKYAVDVTVPTASAGNAGDYIDVEFVLNENVEYRFYIENIAAEDMEYNNITLTYTDYTGEVVTVDVTRLSNSGTKYWVDLNLPAYEICGNVTLTLFNSVAEVNETVTYSIANYYADAKAAGSDAELLALVEGLYAYASSAKAYVESKLAQ